MNISDCVACQCYVPLLQKVEEEIAESSNDETEFTDKSLLEVSLLFVDNFADSIDLCVIYIFI